MSDLPYRYGANAIVIDDHNNFLLVQKISYDQNQWEFPGGGLDEGEDPKIGLLRELKEELGTSNFEIIHKSPYILRFEWPRDAQEHGFVYHGKWWRGQEKHQYVVKFYGEKKDLQLQKDEIRQVKWIPYSDLEKHLVFRNQWQEAKKVLEEAGLVPKC